MSLKHVFTSAFLLQLVFLLELIARLFQVLVIAQTFHKVTLEHQKEPQLDKYHHFSQL